MRILLVEDDAAFAELVKVELEGIPSVRVVIERADTLGKALSLLPRGEFDLVLTDLNLPDSRRLETLGRLAGVTDRLIVVMTGDKDEGLRDMAVAQGAYDLVEKDSLDRRELERLIRLAAVQANALRRFRESAAQSEKLSQLLAALNAANEVLLRAKSAEELLRRACEVAVQANDFALGAVYLRTEGSTTLERAAASGPAAWLESPLPSTDPTVPEGRGFIGQAFRSGAAVVSNDYARDPVTVRRGVRRSYPIGSVAVFPLKVDGEVAGVFGLQHARPGVFTEEITALLQRLADNIAFALANFRRDDAMRRFRMAMDNSADLIVLVDRATMKFVDVNETACRLLGYSREELLATGPHEILPVTRAELEAAYDALIADPAKQGGMKSHYRCKDGSLLPFESTRHVLRSGDRWLVAAISRDMRESFAAERALRESEERYRSLVELSSDWYWVQDANFRFVRMSGRVLPHVRDARMGRTCWEMETDEPVEGTWDEHRAKVERHEPYKDLVLRCRRADGSVGYVSVSGQPVYRNGVFLGYEGSTKDITDKMRAEEELRASEERFRQLTELSSDWYWEQGPDFRIVRMSVGGDPMLANAVTGKAPWELQGTEPVVGTWDEHRERLARHEPFRDQLYRMSQPDGARRYLSVSGKPIFDDGEFRGYRGTAKDVTSQVGANEVLQRFRTALDNSADLILIIDPLAMRYVDANATACRLLGYTREEILALGPHDVLPVPREQIEKSYAALIAGSEADGVMNSHYIRKDGTLLPFESTRHKVRSGERWLIAAISRDISQRVAAETALSESEGRFRALTQLSSDVFWEQDAEFRFTSITGLGAERKPGHFQGMIGKRRWELPSFNMTQADWTAHRALLAGALPFRDLELGMLGEDGEVTWASVSGAPIFDEQGALKGYRGVGKDITARKHEERLRALEHSIARDLADASSVPLALPAVMGAICRSENWQCGRYFALDADAEAVSMRYVWTDGSDLIEKFVQKTSDIRYTRGKGLVGRVWESGEPLWVDDTSADPRVARPDVAREIGIRAALVVPIAFEGRVMGVMSISSLQVRAPNKRLLQSVRLIGAQIGQFIQRKNAEAALAESEARFRQAFELAASGIAHVGMDGRLLRVNRQLCDMLGYDERGLMALTVAELTHPDDAGVSEQGIRELRKGHRSSYRFEKRYRHKSGTYVWFSINVAVVRGEKGTPLYEIAVLEDITERQSKDAALRASEERFRSLTELSSDFYWESDAQHRLREVIHGSGHRPVVGAAGGNAGRKRWEIPSLYPDAAGWAAHERTLEAHLPFRDFEFARLDAQGNERHLSISGEPVFDSWGEFAGYRGIGKDITARKREERLLKLEHSVTLALAEAESASSGMQAVIRLIAEADGWWGGRYWEEDLHAGVLRLRDAWAPAGSVLEAFNVEFRSTTLAPGEGLGGLVWRTGEALWIADMAREPRARRQALAPGVPRGSTFVFPITSGRRTLGVLALDCRVVRQPNERMLQAVKVIAPQVGQFLERQRGAAALRDSEERFRNLSELSSDWYWEQDENLRFSRLYGNTYSNLSQDMIGKTRWDAPGVDPSSPEMREHIKSLERRERFRDFEYSYRSAEGRRVHVRVSGYPVYDADGRFTGYRGMARNVTRQRESREQLRRFRTALDASADIILLVDPRNELRLLDFNETACYYLGYTREELLGRRSDMLIRGMPAEQLQSSLEQLLRREDRTDLVLRTYRRKDGSTFEAEVLRRVVDSDEGPIVVVNARDLTERRRAEERQAAHLRYQEATARFGQAALGKRDAGALIEQAVEMVREALGGGFAAYVERGGGDNEAVVRGVAGTPAPQPPGAVLALQSSDALGRVFASGEPVLVDPRQADALPRFPWEVPAAGGAFVPVHADREVRGVLAALSTQAGALGPEEAKFLVAAASVLSAGLSRIESEQRLAFLAQFDVLTGLPNRALLRDRFSQLIVQARRHGTILGVLFIDLDDFKLVNDSLGHAGGDDLLKAVASRLLAAVRPGDTVARISGDEFAVILGDLARPDDGAVVAQKILDRLAPPLALGGQEVFVTASVGIAAFPADGDDAEALLAAADAAMYRAKQAGRGGYQFFTPDINQRTRARAQLGSELRRALERDEFEIFYQPKFDLRSGRPCAAEALLRWRHPERGIVSPAEFVPVLEETGLIVPVGEAVLRRACEDLKRWAGAGLPPTPVAVNLSARQFRQQNLDARILELVQGAGVDPRHIELEITESQLMHDPEHAARVLRALSEAGIRVAIDDFGTGYSSLSYLTRFPVSALKIDRSFVADVLEDQADAAIVRAIIDMAHTLGFIVVAEGVETEPQAALLRSLGCEQAQGYYFARPMPQADLAGLLDCFRPAAK